MDPEDIEGWLPETEKMMTEWEELRVIIDAKLLKGMQLRLETELSRRGADPSLEDQLFLKNIGVKW